MKAERARLKRLQRLERVRAIAKQTAASEKRIEARSNVGSNRASLRRMWFPGERTFGPV